MRTEFFADEDDLRRLLEAFRALGEFRYTATLSEVNAELAEYHDPLELMNAARVTPQVPNRSGGYIITDVATPIVTHHVKMADGSGVKLTLDQTLNPDSARIALGGDAGDQTLISGIVDTVGETERARAIHALFKKAITKVSTRISAHFVMPGAQQKLDQGWRLTAGKGFHRSLDLKKQ